MQQKNTIRRNQRRVMVAAVAAACFFPAMAAQAGGTISISDEKSVSVGFSMRGGYSSVENGAPNGTSRSNTFSLDSALISMSGAINKNIKGMLTTEKDIAGKGFQVIDANVQLEIMPELAIWVGRFVSPSDRANMAGPYYSLGGGYWSGIASRYGYNGGYIGRDDGVAVVGSVMGGKVGYSFGAFEGNTAFRIAPVTIGARTGSDNLMFAGRVQFDLWDAEPGYYGTGNYLGGKDILAIGVAARSQVGGSVSSTQTGNYVSASVDFLMEKKDVGPGAVSVESAYYNYNTDGVFLSEQGKAFSAGAGYIFQEPVGWGQFQPLVRYQKFNPDDNIDTAKYELGVNYIIDGYSAQVSAVYSNTKKTNARKTNAFNVAMQFQF